MIYVMPTTPKATLAIRVVDDFGNAATATITPNTGPTRTDLVLVHPGIPNFPPIVKVLPGRVIEDLLVAQQAMVVAKIRVESNVDCITYDDITLVAYVGAR